MSTNSIVGTRTQDHPFRGRYVHWDGYPEGVGQAVAEIVRRDGFKQAVDTLTVQHVAWAQVSTDVAISTWRDDITVTGYGIAYAEPDAWHDETDSAGAEWAYAITPDVIEVWQNDPSTGNVWARREDLDISTHGGWYLEADNEARRFGPYPDETAAINARRSLELPSNVWKPAEHR